MVNIYGSAPNDQRAGLNGGDTLDPSEAHVNIASYHI